MVFNGKQKHHGTPQKAARQSYTEKATAPYNFVSLPEKVLSSEIGSVKEFKKHICEHGKISGEIELEIETLSPLLVGDGNLEIVNNFAPSGKFIIPGSSLRGMFKNIFKIVTCGAFRGRTKSQEKGEDFNDEYIYFRCMMPNNQVKWSDTYNWSKDLNDVYSKKMQNVKFENGKRKVTKKTFAGFLIKKNGEYFIAPLDKNCSEGTISIRDRKFQYLEKSCVLWDGVAAYTFTGKGNKKKVVRYIEITDIDWNNQENWLPVPDEVLSSYEHDRNRKGVNLLEDEKDKPKNTGILNRTQLEKLFTDNNLNLARLNGVETVIACHYLSDGKKIKAFGHGQYFRVPYENSIGKIVPQDLKSEKTIDFADAVFGSKENWASRVYFEDAVQNSGVETLEKNAAMAYPLMQPNPTSYQLYLQQEDGKPLKHWDLKAQEIQLRGYKLYWHNNNWDWKLNEDETTSNDEVTKKLNPLKVGSKFKSKIRFQNLSEIELGALLMIFNLNDARKRGYNPAYKIGMGKPFGFGSIKITPKLLLESDDAYTVGIFDSEGFKSPYSASDTQSYIKVFKDYLGGKIGLKSWENVIDELNKILDWNNTKKAGWSKKIAPMKSTYDPKNKTLNVDEKFKMRAPLQSIFEVVK